MSAHSTPFRNYRRGFHILPSLHHTYRTSYFGSFTWKRFIQSRIKQWLVGNWRLGAFFFSMFINKQKITQFYAIRFLSFFISVLLLQWTNNSSQRQQQQYGCGMRCKVKPIIRVSLKEGFTFAGSYIHISISL